MSIAKYVYLSMHDYFESDGYLLKYSKTETVRKTSEIEHRILRQVFSDYGIKGVDFNSSADIPAGTGLGSSSAFTVGLLNLCNAYQSRYEPRNVLAAKACQIEIEKLGEPIGKQDQYGCALGGLNFIEFHTDDSVTCEAVPLSHQNRRRLEDGLVMFYLGGTRSASAVLKEQTEQLMSNKSVESNLKAMVRQARSLRAEITTDIDVIGPYLREGWERKRSLASGISNPKIEDAYKRAMEAGATGGKLLGAGSAGFLLVYAPDGARDSVCTALSEYRPYDVRLDPIGTTIVYSE
ncbi:GHMP kinase [Bradyrhizobium sp. 40]|uniref:GHMP family kinase ATP-binding protein n=1 Tax=Bradyrhizobium sp. 40 TaxID=2782674 RepID=UPI0020003232|nr:GHMP kinase [Bradyrhizobium sp. 40]